MSICGGCPYPFEAVQSGEYETEEEACSGGCDFEDAAYRMSWSYDQLYERYKNLLDEHRALEQKYAALQLKMEDDLR